jgi:FkbM family methyltransferase
LPIGKKETASFLANEVSRVVNLVPGLSYSLLGILRWYAVTHTLNPESLRRLTFWSRLIIRSQGEAMIHTPSGLCFNAFDQSQYVNQILLLKGTRMEYCWEPNGSRLLSDLVRQDDRVVVAGANIGFEALLIGNRLRNGNGICYAFEPIPGNLKTFIENIGLNRLEHQVKPLNFALSDMDTKTSMMAAGPNSSLLFLDSGERKETVTVRSLDSLFREGMIEPISAMISDVEGFELEMILGAERLMSESPIRFIMFEVNGKTEEVCPGKTVRLFGFLANMGFQLFAVPDDYRGYQKPVSQKEKIVKIHNLQSPFILSDRWFNVLAVKPEIVPELSRLITIE